MHIFQRGVNQSLVIGQDMVITVLDIQPHCVRLGITDPDAIPPYWEETLYLDGVEADAECVLELAGSRNSSW